MPRLDPGIHQETKAGRKPDLFCWAGALRFSNSHFKQPQRRPRARGDPSPLAAILAEGVNFITKTARVLGVWVPAFAGTTGCELSFSRHGLSEVCDFTPPLKNKGRREDRVHAAPAIS